MAILGFIFLLAAGCWALFCGLLAAYACLSFGGKKIEAECWILICIGVALLYSAFSAMPITITLNQ